MCEVTSEPRVPTVRLTLLRGATGVDRINFRRETCLLRLAKVYGTTGAACGRRYRLKCLSGSNKPCKDGTVDVTVVDYCPKSPCPSTILLSSDAFGAISRSPQAKINAEYILI
ncbi:hypothetical protein MLD38_014610 [Melastoma candidum]|uniref:Uncharacterized protein n=1 Tax=Melastoma candidum TaxID=119954 RepID=A0ACB9RDA8_9MYRT|nr:hypothetical protein MLD38_014610 [Melastoma candidum]